MGRFYKYLFFFLFLLFCRLCFASEASDVLLQIGKKYYLRGNYEQAVHELNKALMADPSDQLAKAYLEESRNKLRGEQMKVALDYIQENKDSFTRPQEPPSKEQVYPTQPSREAALRASVQQECQIEKALKTRPEISKALTEIEIRGDYQVSIGIEDGEIIGKRANYDLNEENYRTLSPAAYNNYENTYDPAIYSQIRFQIDGLKEEGLGFYTNIDISPFSFIGKTNKVTVASAWGDTADVQLKYWANTRYTVNDIVYTNLLGNSFALPEVKVVGGRTLPFNALGLFWPPDTFPIPELDIQREFWPLRELWFDYNTDLFKARIFPAGLENQAYTSDDIMGLSNHKIYWEESPWLDEWAPGHQNTGAPSRDFFKGYWDDSLSSFTKDSSGIRLTNLRGFSLSAGVADTNLDFTMASPKDLWQDYEDFDTMSGVLRLTNSSFERLRIGGIYTYKVGYNNGERDSTNQVAGADVNYGINENTKASLEIARSLSVQDRTSAFKTDDGGNAVKLSLTHSSQEEVFDKDYFGVQPEEDSNEAFYKARLEAAHMDKGFEAGLSNYRETRDDSFWSRHMHFRKPFDYYYTGIYQPSVGWDDIKVFSIGDGIDYGRDAVSLRLEFANLLDSRLDGLFDVRNVHQTGGKFLENVARLETTYRVMPRLTAKFLGIYHSLPKTKGGVDPFLIITDLDEPYFNNAIPDGADPSLKTLSMGAEYELTEACALSFIWEHTNDSTLTNDNFPRGLLTWSSFTVYPEYDMLFRKQTGGLNYAGAFPVPDYPYYDIFRAGLRLKPVESVDIFLNWTRNEYELAQAIDDNFNHIGLEVAFTPCRKLGFYLRYAYSRMYDYSELNDGQGLNLRSHHNFFSEARYRVTDDSEFIMQYGAGGVLPIGVDSTSPFGGSLPVLDTQHIVRAYYRRKF